MAKELQASMFYPEHRYYGQSIPTINTSTSNLRFLSVEQSLADLASFIVQIKRMDARYMDSKVILVGGSYAGSMVAWFRKQYPHLAVGAWASSAPILAKAAFVEYKEIVGASIRSIGGSACYDRINNSIAAAEELVAENRMTRFNELFQVCNGFGSHPLDVPLVFSSMSNVFAGYVQYHSHSLIEDICDELLENNVESNDLAESFDLVQFAAFFRKRLRGGCHAGYTFLAEDMRELDDSEGRSWLYQTCTEFGWYHTAESKFQPFGSTFTVDLYFQLCRDVFGPQFGERATLQAIDRTNVILGGWDLDVSNVYFTNGLVDPWRAMGIQEDLNESSPADVIPGASHCMDLLSMSPDDTEEMRAVKERISSLVRHWLELEDEL